MLAAMFVLACCGGNDTTVVHNRMVSKEQEAADLKRAFEAGLLSPEEYQQQKGQLGL